MNGDQDRSWVGLLAGALPRRKLQARERIKGAWERA
jgi:hypothetical protein